MPSSLSRFGPFVLFALLVAAWIAPYAIVGHTYPVPTFYAEYTAYGLYVLVAVAVGALIYQSPLKPRASSPKVAIVPVGLALVLLAQTVILPTAQPSMNVLGACSLLLAAMIVHSGYWTSRLQLGDDALRWIAWALIVGGLFALFCQVVQLFHAESRFAPFVVVYNVLTERRPFGNMAQANHLATYIAFALAASVFLVQSRRLNLIVWLALACLYSIGLALTVSRTPWLQVAVIVIAGLAMARAERRHAGELSGWQNGRRWLVPVLTLLAFVAMNMLVRALNHRYGLQLAESAASRFQDASQISPRLSLWKYGWTMFTTHPLLGVGWGEFPRFQYLLVEHLGRVEIANNSHDVIVDLLAKTGIVGGAIVAIGFALWGWRTLRAPHTAARLFAFALLATLGVHALVEYPQQYLFFLFPAAFLIGILETGSMRRTPPIVSAIGYGAVTLAGVAMAYPVMADYHRAETLYYGDHPAQEYRSAPSTIFGAWGQFGMATLLPLNAIDLDDKLVQHQKAIALLPGEVVLRRYAILRAIEGDTPGALDQVKRLKIFAEALHDWPSQLHQLYQACDQNPNALADFQNALLTSYGRSNVTDGTSSDDDDDDSDDDSGN